ncbi:MAG: GyrI-like domain-containing protein [Ignavibacteria bacterium]
MTKIDMKKQYAELFNPPVKNVVEVDVPCMNYLMINGNGDPNNSEKFNNCVESLYSVAYTLKFMCKKEVPALPDYVVPPLEGLWWCDDMKLFSIEDKSAWKWTLMIMQPEFINTADVEKASVTAYAKKQIEAIKEVRFENYHEGRCAQIMHIGPYSDETPTILKLHNFIKENGHSLRGFHHEIYLSDPRKADPAKMKTIIRQPFE